MNSVKVPAILLVPIILRRTVLLLVIITLLTIIGSPFYCYSFNTYHYRLLQQRQQHHNVVLLHHQCCYYKNFKTKNSSFNNIYRENRCSQYMTSTKIGTVAAAATPTETTTTNNNNDNNKNKIEEIRNILSKRQQQQQSTILYLSDLPTPSYLIDYDIIERYYNQYYSNDNDDSVTKADNKRRLPTLYLNDSILIDSDSNNQMIDNNDDHSKTKSIDLQQYTSIEKTTTPSTSNIDPIPVPQPPPPFIYLHCQVEESITNGQPVLDNIVQDNNSYYCIPTNVPYNFTGILVLGLNNHHVISYYWSRSSGYGSSMIAPGVLLSTGTNQYLYPNITNTNDGKRSEWVKILKQYDQIQFVPTSTSTTSPTTTAVSTQNNNSNKITIDGINSMFTFTTVPIFGISRKNRPLGSEPIVIGEYVRQQQQKETAIN